MIAFSGARTILRCDNLRAVMRDVHYALIASGITATHILASPKVMSDYEGLLIAEPDPTTITAPPLTFFKDLLMDCDAAVPSDELHFMWRGAVVGKVTNIS